MLILSIWLVGIGIMLTVWDGCAKIAATVVNSTVHQLRMHEASYKRLIEISEATEGTEKELRRARRPDLYD